MQNKENSTSSEFLQFQRMTTAPIRGLIIMMAIPTIISMLVTSLYNMADTYFVSQLGKSASGAVGVVYSLMAVIQALGFTLGMGSGSLISRSLGKRDKEYADRVGNGAFFLALAIGIITSVAGLLFLDPLMQVLGATETVLPYARDYARYILFGAPVMMGSFVLNNILRAEGKARASMFGLASGGILNILLDPIFIYSFHLGISGAAIATLISQCVSFVLLLIPFVAKKSVISMNIGKMSRFFSDYLEIIRTGLPSFCRQGLASISTIFLNRMAGEFGGDAALSGMSITSKIFMLIFCVGLGVGQGYQPVVGYNYGAGLWKRVRSAFRFTWLVNTCTLTFFGLLSFLFADHLLPLFIDDPEVIQIGATALRFQAISMPLISTNVICNMTFQSSGQKTKAVLLSSCRQGFFFLPLVFLLPMLLGLTGVEMVQAASDVATFFVSLPFAIGFHRWVTKKAEESPLPV